MKSLRAALLGLGIAGFVFGLLILAATSAVLALTAGWIITLAVFAFAVAFCGSALAPSVQSRLIDVAGDYPSIAAALNHSAFNVGNSLGAALGSVVIYAGLGFSAPAWVGAVLAIGGLGILVPELPALGDVHQEALSVQLPGNTDDAIEAAISAFVRAKKLKVGDTVIVTAGVPAGTPGNTNMILVKVV